MREAGFSAGNQSWGHSRHIAREVTRSQTRGGRSSRPACGAGRSTSASGSPQEDAEASRFKDSSRSQSQSCGCASGMTGETGAFGSGFCRQLAPRHGQNGSCRCASVRRLSPGNRVCRTSRPKIIECSVPWPASQSPQLADTVDAPVSASNETTGANRNAPSRSISRHSVRGAEGAEVMNHSDQR